MDGPFCIEITDFSFLPYKSKHRCAKIIGVILMVEWIWIPISFVVGVFIGIFLLGIVSANNGRYYDD